MKILKIYPGSINERHIAEAADALTDGRLVVYPTDTLYAIAADATNRRAIERLCRLKHLDPDRNLLSIVCCDLSQASEYVRIDNNAYRVVRRHLPGPFTFVLPASTRLPKMFKGRRTVGVRIPDNDIARALAEKLGRPLLTSSVDVNPDDPYMSTEPESIAMTLANDVEIIIDGGSGGTEPSTVVDITEPDEPVIVRQGAGMFEL